MPRDAVQAAVATVARAGGFKGGPRTWRRGVPLGIVVMNLQKSSWGPRYYVNFGLYVRSLGPLQEPRAEQCHYSARAESAFSISEEWMPERWKDLLDLECEMPDDERRREIEMFLTEAVLPMLDQLGTEEGLRRAFRDGRLTQALMVDLKKYLEDDESRHA